MLNKGQAAARAQPYATYSTFQNSVPQLFADVDRIKAKRQGVPLSSVFDTLQAYWGPSTSTISTGSPDYSGMLQAEAKFRNKPETSPI